MNFRNAKGFGGSDYPIGLVAGFVMGSGVYSASRYVETLIPRSALDIESRIRRLWAGVSSRSIPISSCLEPRQLERAPRVPDVVLIRKIDHTPYAYHVRWDARVTISAAALYEAEDFRLQESVFEFSFRWNLQLF